MSRNFKRNFMYGTHNSINYSEGFNKKFLLIPFILLKLLIALIIRLITALSKKLHRQRYTPPYKVYLRSRRSKRIPFALRKDNNAYLV